MFSMRDIYPNYPVQETTEKTIPEAQQRQDPGMQQRKIVATPDEQNRIWIGIVVLIIVMILLNLKY